MRRRQADPVEHERRAVAALGRGLAEVDAETLGAIVTALDRHEAQLTGGAWGSREDGEGCLLTLAAWELGLPEGEDLMRRSVAAVRLPALFDAVWALVVQRTGDPTDARRIVHRLVRVAAADLAADADATRRDDALAAVEA